MPAPEQEVEAPPDPKEPLSDPVRDSFVKFRQAHQDEILRVQTFMAKPLSDNPAILNEQVRQAEAWYGRMTTLLAWANSYLKLAEEDKLVPKGKDVTDLDREKTLAAAVAEERRFRDVIEGLAESIDKRVSLVQSMMRAINAEGRMGT